MILNKKSIEALSLPKQEKPYAKIFHDDKLKGFALRVTSAGAKTFIINKKHKGRVLRINIASFGEMTAEQARKQAQKLLGQIAAGIDPSLLKEKHKPEAVKLGQVFDDYISRKKLSNRTLIDYRSVMNNFFKDWLRLPMTEITRDMISKRHAKIGEQHEARANNAFRVLRALFNFAMYQYADQAERLTVRENPVMCLTQTRAWYKNKRRTTKISRDSLPAWFKAVESLSCRNYNSIEFPVRYYLFLLIFTGLRREEAANLQWFDKLSKKAIAKEETSFINLKEKLLFIAKPKNREKHWLPLAEHICEIFNEYQLESATTYVFPGMGGKSHIKEPKKVVRKVVELSNVSFTLHDLRRTYASMANEIGIPHYTIKRLLNHKSQNNDVTAGYVISDLDFLRQPVNQIAEYILQFAQPSNNKIE